MKLAIIFNHSKINGRLTKFWTGCYAYHVAWVDDDAGIAYDMSLLRRRRPWPGQYSEDQVMLYDFPEVTREYLEDRLTNDPRKYGFKDYVLFGMRWLHHLFGMSTRNAGGVICSEMCNEDARACGVETPWPLTDGPPSPCDWYRWCMMQTNRFCQ